MVELFSLCAKFLLFHEIDSLISVIFNNLENVLKKLIYLNYLNIVMIPDCMIIASIKKYCKHCVVIKVNNSR